MDDHPPPSERGSFPHDPRSHRPILHLPLSQREVVLQEARQAWQKMLINPFIAGPAYAIIQNPIS